jgi:hypothetical protein
MTTDLHTRLAVLKYMPIQTGKPTHGIENMVEPHTGASGRSMTVFVCLSATCRKQAQQQR